jgi:hypothetical protein
VDPVVDEPAADVLVTMFRRLFEGGFVTLERCALSHRGPDGHACLDETSALAALLEVADGDGSPLPGPGDPELHALHRDMLAAWPEYPFVVSGPSRHLRALLAEGLAMPLPTSMMRKRGISDLAEHLVDHDALSGPRLAATLASARETADRKGMKHVLVITPDGTVHVAGPLPWETMAHYSNVEFSARVECLRIEERAARGAAALTGPDGGG